MLLALVMLLLLHHAHLLLVASSARVVRVPVITAVAAVCPAIILAVLLLLLGGCGVVPAESRVCLAVEILPVDLRAADVSVRLEELPGDVVRLVLLLQQVYLLVFFGRQLGLL